MRSRKQFNGGRGISPAAATHQQADRIAEYVAYLTIDIEDIEGKPHLAAALASHTARHTKLSQPLVHRTICEQMGWPTD